MDFCTRFQERRVFEPLGFLLGKLIDLFIPEAASEAMLLAALAQVARDCVIALRRLASFVLDDGDDGDISM